MDETEKIQIINALAKFKADLLWDDIVGIFDIIPPEVKDQIENYYQNALLGASSKLQISLDLVKAEVEDLAFKQIDGQTYSPVEIKARLKEYGINDTEKLD